MKKTKGYFNKLILASYALGWDDCYFDDDSNKRLFKKDSILKKAYEIGWADYIMGDDITSVDSQTDKQIIKKILKNENNKFRKSIKLGS